MPAVIAPTPGGIYFRQPAPLFDFANGLTSISAGWPILARTRACLSEANGRRIHQNMAYSPSICITRTQAQLQYSRLGREAMTGQDGCRQHAAVIATEHAFGEPDHSESVR